MEQFLIYIAAAVGAAGLYMVLARESRPLRIAGALVGLAGFAWLLGMLMGSMAEREPDAAPPPVVFFLFAFLALGAAGRMITHSKPVYSALYFVLVVISSASIFLLLEAEFMAFALVIVYAGAILITYLFVLMLAQQTPTEDEAQGAAVYDRVPREPAAGVAVGFLVLALLSSVIFDDERVAPARSAEARLADIAAEMELMPDKERALVEAFREEAGTTIPPESTVALIGPDFVLFELPSGRTRQISFAEAGLTTQDVEVLLTQNIERVGMALVYQFPVSLELAGVILLMAMFGAVVLARKQIELGEDEKRVAAGMSRLGEDTGEEPPRGGSA